MDRAGRKAPPLTPDELKAIFGVVRSGRGRAAVRALLSERSRITVDRAYNVLSEFERRSRTSLDDQTAQEIAGAAKYGASVTYVRNMYSHWRTWQRQPEATGPHDELLRKVMEHVDHWVRRWYKLGPLHSSAPPEVRPYQVPPLLVMYRGADSDPHIQALFGHLEGTPLLEDIRQFGPAKDDYLLSLSQGSLFGDARQRRSNELQVLVNRIRKGLRELLLRPRIPGSCPWCASVELSTGA